MSDATRPAVRAQLLIAALGMIGFSVLTIRHYFAANFPATVFEGSVCDLSAFFNCDSSAYSSLSAIWSVPLGYFGAALGGLFALGALFPSAAVARTNRALAAVNGLGVLALLAYTVIVLGSLCLLCSGYYLFSFFALFVLWRDSAGTDVPAVRVWATPSLLHGAVFGIVTLAGAYGFNRYHAAREDAMTGGVAARIVEQYYGLPTVPPPSIVSPYWSVRSTERFEDAPIQLIEYAGFLCSGCLLLHQQLESLKQEFAGKLNVAFQFFPLDAQCNDVVETDKHPGACDLSYMAAYDPARFAALHDEIFAHPREAKDPAWRAEFARRHGVEAALTDSATRALVYRIMRTGAEYERTSDRFAAGIRSTPTMILNGRMLIGTFPYEQLRAIFLALVDEREGGGRFLENWIETD